MRVVFLGNVGDYSPRFLSALSRRSAEPSDRVVLAAVICPVAAMSRRRSLSFSAKRRASRALELLPDRLLPAPLVARLRGERAGLPTRMQHLAARARAPIFWPRSPNDPELCQRVRGLGADLAIVAGLDRILKDPAFESFPPIVNVHPSLLPEFRGAVPEFWQLDSGATEGGVTIHRVEPGLDTGPILLQRRFAIEPWLDAEGLVAKSAAAGVELVNELLDGYPASAQHATPQTGGSYQPIPHREHQLVPYDRPAGGAFNRARAIGFRSPLLLYVPRDVWQSGAPESRAVAPASAGAVKLELYDPVPLCGSSGAEPGSVFRSAAGVAVACNPGVLLFRRVVAQDTPEHGVDRHER